MEKAPAPYRSLALDALRGFAILTMILSSRIPYGVLPGWMYHVQVPPPRHTFDPMVPGISWVDLVFPFFLFAMGAAFPLALSRKKASGVSALRLTGQIVWRGILLMFFALTIMAVRPHSFDPSLSASSLLLGLLMFGCMFLVFFRYPEKIKKGIRMLLQFAGYAGIFIFFFMMKYPDGSGFLWKRYDIIILVLSNVAIAGSLIWVATETSYIWRLAIMAGLLAIRLSFNAENNWIHSAGVAYPSWMLFQLYFLKYLFIVIPGTIAGDIILSYSRQKRDPENEPVMNRSVYAFISFLMFYMIYLSLAGLYTRLVWQTTAAGIALCGITFYLFRMNTSAYNTFLRSLFSWGAFWFVLGLLFEPFEGGIKKDHSTMSYYFVTSGLAVFMLIGFSILIDIFKKQRWLSILIDNGQNPMLAYAGGTNLLTPLVLLLYIDQSLAALLPGPWPGALKGIIVTGILGLIVQFFTRKKIFWRT